MEIKLKRYEGNPILLPTSNSWENKAVFNAGATTFNDRVLLLYRAQGDDKISRFGLALSDDGFRFNERWANPIFEPDSDVEYETAGVEDPRITKIGNSYYIAYTAASLYPSLFNDGIEERASGEIPWRVRVSLAHTHDFKTFTRHGVIISHIDSKDAALFPEKMHNEFLLLHRFSPDIRLAVADDISRFKERGPVFGPMLNGWDSTKVGTGAPPIKTPYGWVLIYHGVADKKYGLGLALLDEQEPLKVLNRTEQPILEAETAFETTGQTSNVVFCCGAVEKNGQLLVYYGGADSSMNVATVPYDELLNWAKTSYEQAKH